MKGLKNEKHKKDKKGKRKHMILALAGAVGILVIIEGSLLILMSLSVGSFTKYWQRLAAQDPQQHAIIYAVLGDSTGQGIGATSPGRSYPALVAKDLSRKYNRPVHVINLSVSNAKAADVLEKQLPALHKLPVQPDLITMEIGANDIKTFKAEKFRPTIEAICKELPVQSYVADVPWFGARMANKQPDVLKAGQIIRESVSKYGLHQVNLKQATKVSNSPRMFAADLFHPSNHGYTVWERAFWEVIAQDIIPKKP